MLKDLLKEGGLYTLANLLTKGLSLLLLPFYADYFTKAEYGILAMLGIAGALSAAVFSFQIYQGVGRFISEKEQSLEDKRKIGSTGFWFTFLSYCGFLVVGILFQDQIINLLSEDEQIKASTYLLSIGAVFVYGLFYALSVQLKFLRMTKAYSITTFLQAILNIVLILFLALAMDMRIDSVYMASIIITPLMILVQIYFLRDYLILYLGKLELKMLMNFSTPLIPAAVAYLILNFTDRIFIKEINASLGDVGVYDMAFKFSSILSIILFSFQSALAPLIYEQHQNENTKTQLGRIFRLFVGVGTIGGLALSCFSYETLYLFTQPDYYEAAVLMPVFYLSVMVTGMGLFSPGLHIKNKTQYIPLIVIFTALINIGLNYLLVPVYGLLGAAIATLVSVFCNNAILFIISQKLYRLVFPKRKTFIVLTIFMLLFLIGSYIDRFIDMNYTVLLIVKIVTILGYVLFLMRFEFINFQQIMNRLLKKRKSNNEAQN